jgi:hypothetical protein
VRSMARWAFTGCEMLLGAGLDVVDGHYTVVSQKLAPTSGTTRSSRERVRFTLTVLERNWSGTPSNGTQRR